MTDYRFVRPKIDFLLIKKINKKIEFYKLKMYILYIHGKYSWDSPEHLGCCIFLKTNLECGFRTDLNMLI